MTRSHAGTTDVNRKSSAAGAPAETCYGAGENAANVRDGAFGQRSQNPVRGPYRPWPACDEQTAMYVIGGASRIVPPDTQERLKKTLPNCQVVVMPDLGHYPSEENTEGFMKIINEFLHP